MGKLLVLGCCLCGQSPEQEVDDGNEHIKLSTLSEASSDNRDKDVGAEGDAAQVTADIVPTAAPATDDEISMHGGQGRVARHLLERQPSKSNRIKLQSSSFGGPVGQRWVNGSDNATQDASLHKGTGSSMVPLFQEVKPLYDPVAPPAPSRFGAPSAVFGALASGGAGVPGTGTGGMGSSSMTFARSVNRLSTINTSGGLSRRASLLGIDFAKASVHLAFGSSLHGGIAGSNIGSVAGVTPGAEPWQLQNIFRMHMPAALGPPPSASPHPTSIPLGANIVAGPSRQNFVPSSLPASTSIWAAAAANFGVSQQSIDRDGPSSHGQLGVAAPPATPLLQRQPAGYPVPLLGRPLRDRASTLGNPLVVLVLRPLGSEVVRTGPTETDGPGEGPCDIHSGLTPSEGPVRSLAEDVVFRSDGSSRPLSGPGGGNDPVRLLPNEPVVTSMHLDLPTPAQPEGGKGKGPATPHTLRVSLPYRQQQQQQQPGEPENELKRAHAAVAAALQAAAGGNVALVHAWHNRAAGLLMAAANAAGAAPGGGAAAAGHGADDASERPTSDGDGLQAGAWGPAAVAPDSETAWVLWGLRELFDQDPCLALLARDMLRQAAVRPEHVPPLTHALAPSAYAALLAGREPSTPHFVAGAAPAPAAGTGSLPSTASNLAGWRQQARQGAAILQAALQHGHIRVHVCAFQAPGFLSTSMSETIHTAAALQSSPPPGPSRLVGAVASWEPAIVLEWPQPPANGQSTGGLPPLGGGRSFSSLNISVHPPSTAPRTVMNPVQLRSHLLDHEPGVSSSAALAFDAVTAPVVPPGHGGILLSNNATQQGASGDVFALGAMPPPALPSLSMGMGSASGPTQAGIASLEGEHHAAAGSMSPAACTPAATPSVVGPEQVGLMGPAAAGPMGPELEPLAGAELLYVIQTWQRHHLLLASVPYAITLFDCGGRVLQQNQGSVDFMGEVTEDAGSDRPSPGIAGPMPGAMSSEARESVASMAKAEAEVAGKVGGSGGVTGGGGGGAGAGGDGQRARLMSASEVDVLSVLFCLCPDLLDEMLEEVICGNMWRGIVQVPRVMRPCIRSAQRWGAAARRSVGAAGVSSSAAAAASGGFARAGAAAGHDASPAPSSSAAASSSALAAAGAQSTPYGDVLRETASLAPSGSVGALGGSSFRRCGAELDNSYSSSSNTTDSITAANNALNASESAAAGQDGSSCFIPSQPTSKQVASPLRRLATSVAMATTAYGNGSGQPGTRGLHSVPDIELREGNPGRLVAQRSGPLRRPPARSYSLRGLLKPMSNSFMQPAPGTLQPHRLAQGEGSAPHGRLQPQASAASGASPVCPAPAPEGAALSTGQLHPQVSSDPSYTGIRLVATDRLPECKPGTIASSLRPAAGRHLGGSIFHSFSMGGGARGGASLPRRPARALQPPEEPLPDFTHHGKPSNGSYPSAVRPRSTVLAFAERIRSGRLPGSGVLGGNVPGMRSAPRRLRSGLSLVSRPDEPPPQDPPESDGEGEDEGVVLDASQGEQRGGGVSTLERRTPRLGGEYPGGPAPDQGSYQRAVTAPALAVSEPWNAPAPGSRGRAAGGAAHGRLREDGLQAGEAPAARLHDERDAAQRPGAVGSTQQQQQQQQEGHLAESVVQQEPPLPLLPAAQQQEEDRRQRPSLEQGQPHAPGAQAARESPNAANTKQSDRDRQWEQNLHIMSDTLAQQPFAEAAAIADAINLNEPPTAPAHTDAAGATALTHATPSAISAGGGRNPDRDFCDAVSNDATSVLDLRPHHSVPIECLSHDPAPEAGRASPRVICDAGARNGSNFHSTSVSGMGPAAGHTRASVRRQIHALKRPLSRTSTRTYLMTALPTSTLNVLGRVQSMRQMEYTAGGECEEADGECDERVRGLLEGLKGNEDGAEGRLACNLRAMSMGTAVVLRKKQGIMRASSHGLNVAAMEPRLAVPRIFSFMRSASRRMMEQLSQQHKQQPKGGSGSGAAGAPDGGAEQEGGSGRAAQGHPAASLAARSSDIQRYSRLSCGRLETTSNSHPASASASASGVHAIDAGAYTTHSDLANQGRSNQGSAAASGSTATLVTSPSRQHVRLSGNGWAGESNATAAAPLGVAGPLEPQRQDWSAAVDAGGGGGGFEPLPLPPRLGRLRASEDAEGRQRSMSPRDMSPAEMARRVGMAWHEVAATSFTDPVTGARVVALVQNDVSEKVETEMQLTELMEVEHRLLEQIFPRHVLEHIAMQNISPSQNHIQQSQGGRKQRRKSQFDLLKSQDCSQLAHHHDQITVLFCDVKGFTAMCSSVEPAVVMSFLNMLYTRFDSLLYLHDVYKVETIGDCYMVAGGLVRRCPDGVAALLEPGEVDPEHARKVVHFAKDLLEVVREMRMPNGQALQVRVGLHSGPAMSGVVGTKMPRFCLFGDTINTASRCESTCPPCAIHATTAVRDLVPEESWIATGGVMAKGKGIMRTFLLSPANAHPGAAPADNELVSDLMRFQPVDFSGSLGPMRPATTTVAAVAAPAAAAAPPLAPSFNRTSLRPASGLRRSSRSLAITTTTAAAAAVAAAAAAAATPLASPTAPQCTATATTTTTTTAVTSGASSNLGASTSVAPVAVQQPPAPAITATNSGYLRLPSTNLSSSAVDINTTSLVKNFAPAGQLPHIGPAAGGRSNMAAAETEQEGPFVGPQDLRVVNLLAAAVGLGEGGAPTSRMVVPRGDTAQQHSSAQTSRGHGFEVISSMAAAGQGGALFYDSAAGMMSQSPRVTGLGFEYEHQPRDLSETPQVGVGVIGRGPM